ncbi:response regulator [Azospirillum sp. ST 5-10]|uniref:response regulator n=1 Tax=unclassified Azospirillum TaxID=2630922 RepID=UPI003F4A4970
MTSPSKPPPRTGTARVLVADDHPLFRNALREVVEVVFGDAELIEACDLDEAIAAATGTDDLDLILLDLNMPAMNGFCGLMSLRNEVPTVPVVVVSGSEDPDNVREAITYGAVGFVPKSLTKDAMAEALRTVLAGGVFVPTAGDPQAKRTRRRSEEEERFAGRVASLSRQQRLVLEMLVKGQSNKQIAYLLDVTESTVKAHVSAILRKLNVQSRTQAVIHAGKLSLRDIDAAAS